MDSIFSFAYTVGAILVLPTVAYLAYQCFFSPLAAFPGPLLAKFTSAYFAYLTYRGRSHRDLQELHRKYGSNVRITPKALSIADPAAFREIYRPGGKFLKSDIYDVLQGHRTFDLAGERDEQVHSAQRRLVAQAYSMNSMICLEPKVDISITALLEKLDGLHGEEIDLGLWLQLFAFDVIGAVSFSRPFGYIHAGDEHGIFQRIQRTMISIAWLGHVRWFFHLHQKLMPVLGNWLAATDRNGYFFRFAGQEIVSRQGHSRDDRDILGQLLSTQKVKPQLSDLNINYMMTSNIVAGSDTTSTSLRAIFYLLLTNADKLHRLMTELKEKRAAGALGNLAKFSEAQDCPYLQAVIYEALRLYPAAIFPLDRDVPTGGLLVGKNFVPAGTTVGCSAWVIHRLPEVWGWDPEEFQPERWLDPDTQGDLKRFHFAFGGGSRVCIGRNLSWLTMSKLVPTLCMRYEMELTDNATLEEKSGGLLFLKGPTLYLTPRRVCTSA